MTPDDLRAHIVARIAELEATLYRVTHRTREPWELNDPLDGRAESGTLGQLEAYRDVLGLLPAEDDGQS